jgi:hypothetical protein
MTTFPHRDASTSKELDLRDIIPAQDFFREAERLNLATRGQLQWWFRFRHENGLVSSGAVVEQRPNPKSTRPLLFVVRPRFVRWLAGGQEAP